jgi:hypothetical protein
MKKGQARDKSSCTEALNAIARWGKLVEWEDEKIIRAPWVMQNEPG